MNTTDRFSTPHQVADTETRLGGEMKTLLPSREEIPAEMWNGHTEWNKAASMWFFRGLPKGTVFTPRPGIDVDSAKRHIKAILSSWEPKHEHKEAAAAYLLSKWFVNVEIPKQ